MRHRGGTPGISADGREHCARPRAMASGLEGAFASADDVADAVESRIRAGGPPPSSGGRARCSGGHVPVRRRRRAFRLLPCSATGAPAFSAYHSSVQHPLTWAKRTGSGPEDYKWRRLLRQEDPVVRTGAGGSWPTPSNRS